MVANVSEENDRNENRYQDISKENNAVYNEVRQRNEKEPQKYHINEEMGIKKSPRKPKRVFKAKKAIEKPKKPVRVNLKTPQKDVKNVTKKEPEKSYKYPKQYSYSVNPKIKKPLSTEIPHLDSTIGIAEKFQSEKEMSKIDEPKNPNRFRLTANSKETLPNDFEGLQKVLTTRKEKNEFDQYDNTKYLKAEYVATSGPVVLPKIPSEDWWGKEKKFKKIKDWD
ncbi:hypothetical protein O3G_MSEX000909 [Manduca sexta]|nr:hypothetical protein O3G_MSEX000909 [Manduca sexta]